MVSQTGLNQVFLCRLQNEDMRDTYHEWRKTECVEEVGEPIVAEEASLYNLPLPFSASTT